MNTRLLYLTSETYPTFRSDVDVLFGKILPQHCIQSDIVAGKTPEIATVKLWKGGKTFLCNTSSSPVKKHIKIFLHGCKHMLKADIKRYHAIQVRDMPLMAAIGLLLGRFKGLKLFYWMSYPMPDGQILLARERGLSMGLMKFLFPWVRGHIGYFLLYRVVLPHANHIFVQSNQMKTDLAKWNIQSKKMTPVPMGVDVERLKDLDIHPIDDNRLTGKRILIYLGSLDRPRRIEVLFEMIANVKRKFPNILLLLIGDTQDTQHRKWLKEQAKIAEIADHLIWTGWLPIDQGWRYVRAAEIGLSPIPRGHLLDCSSPTKVPEYLALGIPVVCNDNPDQEQIIKLSGAGICVPYSPEDFANAITKMLHLDENERNKMKKKGEEYVNHYRDYQLIGRHVATVYKTII